MTLKEWDEMTEDDRILIIHRLLYPDITYKPIKKDYDLPDNLNQDSCKKCQGFCCKRCGCHFSPDDFNFKKIDDENGPRDSNEVIFEILRKEMEKGYIVVECIPGEMFWSGIDGMILRARNINEGLVGRMMRSQCILLTENGCKLDYEHRPSGGRLLKPVYKNEELFCKQYYDIPDCCKEWLPFKEVLAKLFELFEETDKTFPCSI